MTIQSILVEVLVILEVLFFLKRISISTARKSPVKIAHLCKNVLAEQTLAVYVVFFLCHKLILFLFLFFFVKPF